MLLTKRHTLIAGFTGYIVQALVNNISPLLYVTFQREFSITLDKIGYIASINFFIQILTDLIAARYADKLGYRKCVCLALIFAASGVGGLGIFPYIFPTPYAGIIFSTIISAIGGGLLEVITSPIVEAIPGDAKSAKMSFLHSFYCWGQVGVVVLSTLFFIFIGIEHWRFLCLFWAIVPIANFFLFLKVPLWTLVEDGSATPLKILIRKKLFWIFLILMLGSGASELAMSQWSSLFAEVGLKVSKSVGDLLGMCCFAVLMGISRIYFGFNSEKLKLENCLLLSSILCIFSYLLTSFAPSPIISLIGCALCGLSVGLMWPGTYSLASKVFPDGGTTMFAILAFAGDIGCTTGPTIVGNISTFVQSINKNLFPNLIHGSDITEIGLKTGLSFIFIFPFAMLISVILLKKKN